MPQQARAYNARRTKDEIEIDNARFKAKGGGKGGGGGDGKFADGGKDDNKDGGKGGGKKPRHLAAADA